jgi:MFS family permease
MVTIPARRFALVMFVGQTLAMAMLAFASGKVAILVGAALFGLTIGNVLSLQPLLLAEAFGTREYGRIYSVSQLLTAFGIAGGPALVGLIEEFADGYTVSYLVVAAGSALGLVILLFAGPGRRKVAGP